MFRCSRVLRTVLLIEPTPQSAAAAKKVGKEFEVLTSKKLIPKETTKVFKLNRPLKPEDLHDLKLDFAKYSHIIMTHDAVGKSVLPRLAAILSKSMISDVTKISGEEYTRLMYAGNVVSTVKTKQTPVIFSVRPTAFAGEPLQEATAPQEEITLKDSRVKTTNTKTSGGDRPELGAAKIVVSGGRALKSSENFKTVIAPLADRLGAAIGASRAAVDAGYVDNAYQVGQTGVVVAPELYIAVGISGAIQHVAGMKDAKVIVAINKDAECPMMDLADYGLVADLFKAVPELTEKLK